MIEINLLPEGLRKKKPLKLALPQFNLPQGNIKKIASASFAFLIVFHLLLQLFIGLNSMMARHAEKALEKIQPRKQEIDEIKAQVDKAKALEGILSRLASGRFEAAPKLNSVSDCLPEGIWLYELSLSKELCEVKGSSVSLASEELAQIGKFLNALKADKHILQSFKRLELASVQRRKLGAIEVVDFILSTKTQEKTDSERR